MGQCPAMGLDLERPSLPLGHGTDLAGLGQQLDQGVGVTKLLGDLTTEGQQLFVLGLDATKRA